jgi:hypothetical protein
MNDFLEFLSDVFHDSPVFMAIAVIVVLIILLGCVVGAMLLLFMLLRFADAVQGTHSAKIVLTVVVILAGIFAHFLKRLDQYFYGVIEVYFGMVSTVASTIYLSWDKATPVQAMSLIGCAYVIARGLNNIFDAKGKINTRTSSASHT